MCCEGDADLRMDMSNVDGVFDEVLCDLLDDTVSLPKPPISPVATML